MSEQEIWVDVPNYEGLYQVSNYGRVKSLSKLVLKNGKYPFYTKEKIRTPFKNKGYDYLLLIKANYERCRPTPEISNTR